MKLITCLDPKISALKQKKAKLEDEVYLLRERVREAAPDKIMVRLLEEEAKEAQLRLDDASLQLELAVARHDLYNERRKMDVDEAKVSYLKKLIARLEQLEQPEQLEPPEPPEPLEQL